MTSFFIPSIACTASGVDSSSDRFFGTICQLSPNLSLTQPHASSLPPSAVRASQ